MRFGLNITTSGAMAVHLGNVFFIALSLGAGLPYAQQRKLRYLVSHLRDNRTPHTISAARTTASPHMIRRREQPAPTLA